MTVTPLTGGARVTYELPSEWLEDPARAFPVVVDPSITLSAGLDVHVRSDYPNNSYSTDTELRCGYYDSTTGHNRAYVRFDCTSIPAISRVDAATFSIYQSHTYYTNTATTLRLGRLDGAFSSSTTWNNKPGHTEIATQSKAGRNVWINWSQAAVKDTVAGWVASPSSNRGFACYQNNNTTENTYCWRKFYSSEYSDVSLRPKLVVDYCATPDPVTSVSTQLSASDWFREVDRNGDGVSDTPNDHPDVGRGTVTLNWQPTARAAGYKIMMFDGDSYEKVGEVVGGGTTSWTTEGCGIFPKDSEIAAWTADARNALTRAATPRAMSQEAFLTVPGESGAGVVVTDGKYLYTRAWAEYPGPSSWTRVGTGFNGTVTGQSYGTIGPDFDGKPILSAFYLDGVIYNGRTEEPTQLVGVPVSAGPDDTNTVLLNLSKPPLKRSTAADAGTNDGAILLASDGERIYSIAYALPGQATYSGYTIRTYDRTGTWLHDKTIAMAADYTNGVLADGRALHLIQWSATDSARVTKVRLSDYKMANVWPINQATTRVINGCYDPVNNRFWLGSIDVGRIYRYAGSGLDLRDSPNALYRKSTTQSYLNNVNYWLRVVPYNTYGEPDLYSCSAAMPTLENRTARVNDEDRDTTHALGEYVGHEMTAVLDESALEVDVTDLVVASWGPTAAVTRHYRSSRTGEGLLAGAPGWRFGFERRIDQVTGAVVLTDERGDEVRFTLPPGSSVYQSSNGNYDSLTKPAADWVVTRKDRSREVYDGVTGKIKAEYDKHGNTVTYTWSTSTLTIAAANSQSITVTFNGSGKATGATYATASGTRAVTYATSGTPSVTFYPGRPESYAVEYTYSSSRLASMTVPGREGSQAFVYDGNGRLTSVRHPLWSAQNPYHRTDIAYQAAQPPMRIEDSSSALTYTGTWSAVTSHSGMSGGTYRSSGTANSTVALSFRGPSAAVIGSVGPAYGIAEVYLDGVRVATIDTFAATYTHQRKLWAASDLHSGTHTLQLKVLGVKNPASTGTGVVFDAMDYTPAGPADATVTTFGDVDSRVADAYARTENSDAGVTYSSTGWTAASHASMSGGTYNYSSAANSTVDFPFQGTSVAWIGARGPAYGDAEVYVDGIKVATVDTYAPAYAYQQKLWEAAGLEHGDHTLQIKVLGTKNPRSSGTVIVLDAVDVGVKQAPLGSVSANVAIDQHYTWNPTGTMATMTDPHLAGTAHATWTYAYSPTNEAISERSPTGKLIARSLDSRGNVTSVTDEQGNRTDYAYDALDQLIRETDPRGCTTYYTYSTDRYGGTGVLTVEEKQLTHAERSRTEYEYDSGGRMTRKRELVSRGVSEVWAETTYGDFALSGEPKTTAQLGVLLQASSTPIQLTTTRDYDAFGNMLAETDAAGARIALNTYDIAGRVLTAEDARGVKTQHRYDAIGNETETWREAPGGARCDQVRKTYDEPGRLKQETFLLSTSPDVVDRTVTNTYDASGRLVQSDDSRVEGVALTRFDARGNAVVTWAEGSNTGSLDAATRSTYDVYGQLLAEYSPGENSRPAMHEYYPNGLTKKTTNPDGSSVQYTYDAGGFTVLEFVDGTAETRHAYNIGGRRTSTVSADGAETTFSYDLLGRQVAAQAEGANASVTVYNTPGWTLAETDADGVATTKTYDEAGRVLSETQAGATTSYEYDPAGGLQKKTNPDGTSFTYGIDEFGRVEEEIHADAAGTFKTITTRYDELSRPVTVTVDDERAGTVRTTQVTYPAGGAETTTITLNYRGVETVVTLDARNRETSRSSVTPAGQIARSVTAFDPADRATAWSVGGLASGRTFDPAGRIETQSGPGLSGTALYTYDETTGRKKSETLPLAYPGAEQSTYDYNDVGRLTFATIGGTETRYAYQPGSGNLVEVRRGSETTTTLSYDSANRLTSMSGPSGTTTYGWDTARGWRTEARGSGEATVTYTYDDAGRMKALTDPNTATTASYTYDARGMRTHALIVRGSLATKYTYSYDGLALLGYSAAASDGTTESVTYLYDADSRAYAGVYAASGISPVAFGILSTDRGDVRALTDASGETFAAYAYDAYGLPAAKLSRGTDVVGVPLAARIAEANVLRYAGYCYDEHSGLYYLAARYYDPASCQFLTKDPAKADGEESAYQYCAGDPVGKVDPSGEDAAPAGVHPAKTDPTLHLRELNGHLGALLSHLPGGSRWKPSAWRDMKNHIDRQARLCVKDINLLRDHLRKGQRPNLAPLDAIASKMAVLPKKVQQAADQIRPMNPATATAVTAAVVVVVVVATLCPVVPPPP